MLQVLRLERMRRPIFVQQPSQVQPSINVRRVHQAVWRTYLNQFSSIARGFKGIQTLERLYANIEPYYALESVAEIGRGRRIGFTLQLMPAPIQQRGRFSVKGLPSDRFKNLGVHERAVGKDIDHDGL